MVVDLEETIVAQSSPPGPGARAVVRLSGPEAFSIAGKIFQSSSPITTNGRSLLGGEIRLPGITSPLPADLYSWPAPRTYTGQNVIEIHTLSCPPLVELLVALCLSEGARAARPGEFTLRAFLAGKLDLTRAEAVHAVIEAGNQAELRQALAQLAGGIHRPLQELRDDLLNLLADLEAGLDFGDEDIRFVSQDELLKRITKGLALTTLVKKQLEQRSLGQGAFRVVLAGSPNAGKSSLFNALAGHPAALVSPEPGTTRDYLVQRLEIEGVLVEVVDTAGWRDESDEVEFTAQHLGRHQAEQADLILWCRESFSTEEVPPSLADRYPVLLLGTKCDLFEAPAGIPATSALTGSGVAELMLLLAVRARGQPRPALAPSLSRCRHHVDACLVNLRRAHAEALEDNPPELIAFELRCSLEELGAMVGAIFTDDLLDRIFSRFCIGK